MAGDVKKQCKDTQYFIPVFHHSLNRNLIVLAINDVLLVCLLYTLLEDLEIKKMI